MKNYYMTIILLILLTPVVLADMQIIEVPVETQLNAETDRLTINIAGGSNQIDVSTKENFTQTYTLQLSKNLTCTLTQGIAENDFTKFYNRFDQFVTVYNDTWMTHATNYIDTKATNSKISTELEACQKQISGDNETSNTNYMYQLAQDAMAEATALRNKACYTNEYETCKKTLDEAKTTNYYWGAGGIIIGILGTLVWKGRKTATDETEEMRE